MSSNIQNEHSSLLTGETTSATTGLKRDWPKYAAVGGALATAAIIYLATAGHGASETTATAQSSPDATLPATPIPTHPDDIVFPTSAPVATTTAPVTTTPTRVTPAPINATAAYAEFFKHMESLMDTSVDPCDNFYQYACGGWLKATTIPETENRADTSFSVVAKDNERIIGEIMASKPPVINAFYEACLAEAAIDPVAVKAVSAQLAHIESLKSVDALLTYAGELFAKASTPSFFDLGVSPDPKNTSLNVIQLSQGGLTLPSIEYYVAQDKFVALLTEYVGAFDAIPAFGDANATAFTKNLLAFETQLANISLPNAALRDPWATYNKFTLQEIRAKYPLAAAFLRGVRADILEMDVPVLVSTPAFFEAQTSLLHSTDLKTLQAYLSFHLVHAQSAFLGESFREANHKFGAVLQGLPLKQDRAKFCNNLVQSMLGEQLGDLFMDKVFDRKTKASAQALIKQIEASMVVVLNEDTWLDVSTRSIGLEKVAKIGNFIGGPDNATALPFNVSATAFYDNVAKLKNYEMAKSIASIGKPVDETAWGMNAFTVNAYNDPTANKIVFPAAILQPPFYDAKHFPAVVNYARIGMVMGHELTHGFDDEGRNFDPSGQLFDWWSPSVKATFQKNAKCLADQYSTFPVLGLDGKTLLGHLNGELTLGENIADNGGLKLAYLAYLRAKASEPSIAEIGYDDKKLYFTAFAQGWCEKRSDAAATLLLNTDPHSPGKWRVHGPLYNSAAFADAFQCKAGSPMNPVNKCIVW